MTPIKTLCLCILCIIVLSLIASLVQAMHQRESRAQDGWWAARLDSSGMAPDARQYAQLAIVQVYAAPTWGWKGVVAVHPWIVFKRAGETEYNRYEVISWGAAKTYGVTAIHRMATGTGRNPVCLLNTAARKPRR